MENFKIYLPSNASSHLYRNNTSSNFSIQLKKPIELQGSWEVGLQSIFYNSDIGDKNEIATADISLKHKEDILHNDVYPIQYKLTDDNKWNYKKYITTNDVEKCKSYNQLLELLNNVNSQMIVKGGKTFQFRIHDAKFKYDGLTSGIIIELSDDLARLIQFGNKTNLTATPPKEGSYLKTQEFNLGPATTLSTIDYHLKVFDKNVVKVYKTIILKKSNENILSINELITKWNKSDIKNFAKLKKNGNSLVLDKFQDNVAIEFSQYFGTITQFESTYLSKRVYTSLDEYNPPKHSDMTHLFKHMSWYVNIYKDEMIRDKKIIYHNLNLNIYPRKYKTITQLVTDLNTKIKSSLMGYLNEKYDNSQHSCQFTFHKAYIQLQIGSYIELELDKSLQHMLGFNDNYFVIGFHMGSRLPTMLDKLEQRILIHTNFTEPVYFGNEKRSILEQIIHNKETSYGIVEKTVDRISYIPVNRHYIDTINIKLTNDQYMPLQLHSIKTVLILQFRKIK